MAKAQTPTPARPCGAESAYARRRFLAGCAAAAATSAATLVAAAADWPRFLGPAGDGRSAETGTFLPWTDRGPPLLWHRPVGAGYGIGSVAGGRYYQLEREDDRAGVGCFDAADGRFLWRWDYATQYEDMLGYNGGPRCSPLIDDGRVYLFGADGMLACLSADGGRPLWQVDTAKRFGVVQNFFGVGSNPVVEGDLLICQIGGSPPESHDAGRFDLDRVKGNGSGIVAFDKRCGAVRYAITDELASYAAPQLATIDGRRWCFVFARGGLVGFNPADGRVDFHFPWRSDLHDSVNASTPIVVGDEVFISEAYSIGSALLRVRPGGCQVVWRDPPGREQAMRLHWATPVYHEGFLYGSSGRHSGEAELRCIEWKTGKVRWSKRGLRRASALYAAGRLIVLGEDGVLRLVAASPAGYQEFARAVVREAAGGERLITPPAWAAPIVADKRLYLRGDDRVVCLRLFE